MKHSQSILFSVLVATFACASVAHADLSRRDLDAISDTETAWQISSAQVSGYNGGAEVYITDQGGLRISDFANSFSTAASLDFPSIQPHLDANVLQKYCASIKPAIAQMKRLHRKYTLTLNVFPFAAQNSLQLAQGAAPSPENPVSLGRITLEATFTGDSNAAVTGVTTESFNRAMQSQLAEQAPQIQQTGVAVLDLSGWDDVACDLVQGQAQLAAKAPMSFESPLVYRSPVVSAGQLQAIYVDAKSSWVNQDSAWKNLVMAGATLGIAAQKRLPTGLTAFGVGNFLSVFAQLFELPSGKLNNMAGANWIQGARRLDVLSRGMETRSPEVIQQISILTR